MLTSSSSRSRPRKFSKIQMESCIHQEMNIPEIARKLGVSSSSVRQWCREWGFTPPSRIRARSDKSRARLYSLFESGANITAIAHDLGCCRDTALKMLREEGLYSPKKELPNWAKPVVQDMLLALEDYLGGVPPKKGHYDLIARVVKLIRPD